MRNSKAISTILLMVSVLFVSSLAMAANKAPVPTITATGNAGMILDITYGGTTYVVADGDLTNGTSTRYNGGSVYTAGSYPSANADNFSLANMTSLDGITHMETLFTEPSTLFFVFENGGNDDAAVQGIDSGGNLTGSSVSITKNSADYGDTTYKSGVGSQSVKGFVFIADNPVYGIRITGQGFDPISVSAVNQTASNAPPEIISTPVTTAYVGQLYTYDVEATGNPAPTYSLDAAPAGMTIDANTGLIEWTPSATGDADVTVVAANGETPDDSQSFTISVLEAPPAGIVPISSITADDTSNPPAINLLSITVGSYTVTVSNLQNGTGSGTGGNTTFPVENADNMNINSFANELNPHLIVNFGGGLFVDENGNNPDFFIFENGGNDFGSIQAIFPDDSLGNPISFDSSDFGDTGFMSNVGPQAIKGLAFEIRDLLDASGTPLTNTSQIKGLRINSGGLDPSCICAVITPAALEAPAITSTAVTEAAVGVLYTYDVETTGNPAPTYSLNTKPTGMTINETTGLIEWTPDDTQTGLNAVEVQATNSEGNDTQSFNINVPVIAPTITSTEITDAYVGIPYEYDVDADGVPAPTYSLDVAPAGMTIDANTGLIEWTPSQEENVNVTVRAANGETPDDTQSFTISVGPAPPAGIVPITAITAEGVSGTDPIDLLSITVGGYTVSVADLRTGTSSGTGGSLPIENADNFNLYDATTQYNPHDVVNFGGGLFSDHNGNNPDFFIFESGGNDGGTIQAIFPDDSLGQPISFNNDSTSWGATGYTSAYAENYGLAFEIRDLLDDTGANLTNSSVIKGIRIISSGLDPTCICAVVSPVPESPEITSSAIVDAVVGELYEYEVTATGYPEPTYALTTAPAGMVIDPDTGVITWTPEITNLGSNAVEIQATNSEGSDIQSFDVVVAEGPLCPTGIIHYWKLDETEGAPYVDEIGTADANCVSGMCPDPNASGLLNGCQVFDGSSTGLLSQNSINPTDAITVMAWIKPADLSQTGPDECIISKYDVFELSIEEDGDKISWVILDGQGGFDEYEPAVAVVEGVWTHVAATFDGTTQTVYINGSKAGDDPAAYAALPAIDNPYRIGWGDQWEDRPFDGALDEVAVYDTALDETKINELYQRGLTGKGYCKDRPEFTTLELISVDGQIGISGDLDTGFELLLNGVDSLYQLDLGSTTATNNSLLPDDSGPMYFGFSLSEPSAALVNYFEAKHAGMPYNDELIAIANGESPIFYVKVTDVGGTETFELIDGFLLDTQVLTPAETPLRINGDYPEGTYDYVGTIYDEYDTSSIITVTMSVCHDVDGDSICDAAECDLTNLDGLGAITLGDFAILAGNWQLTGTDLAGDINRDGSVDMLDVAQIAEHWLGCQ